MVETSVWIDHIRRPDRQLSALLDGEMVVTHPFVIGEIALGRVRDLNAWLALLDELPLAIGALDDDVRLCIDRYAWAGTGIGYVDAHLAVSTMLTPGARLWTRDKKLRAVAERLSIAATELD